MRHDGLCGVQASPVVHDENAPQKLCILGQVIWPSFLPSRRLLHRSIERWDPAVKIFRATINGETTPDFGLTSSPWVDVIDRRIHLILARSSHWPCWSRCGCAARQTPDHQYACLNSHSEVITRPSANSSGWVAQQYALRKQEAFQCSPYRRAAGTARCDLQRKAGRELEWTACERVHVTTKRTRRNRKMAEGINVAIPSSPSPTRYILVRYFIMAIIVGLAHRGQSHSLHPSRRLCSSISCPSSPHVPPRAPHHADHSHGPPGPHPRRP